MAGIILEGFTSQSNNLITEGFAGALEDVYTGVGSIIVSGVAEYELGYEYIASGEVIFSGVAEYELGYEYITSGEIVLSSDTTISNYYPIFIYVLSEGSIYILDLETFTKGTFYYPVSELVEEEVSVNNYIDIFKRTSPVGGKVAHIEILEDIVEELIVSRKIHRGERTHVPDTREPVAAYFDGMSTLNGKTSHIEVTEDIVEHLSQKIKIHKGKRTNVPDTRDPQKYYFDKKSTLKGKRTNIIYNGELD